jgi:predicted DNA binding CopG/RHH family protein
MKDMVPRNKYGTQLNTRVLQSLAHRLRVKLAMDGMTYQEWLEARIREYAPPVRRARKGQEARQ